MQTAKPWTNPEVGDVAIPLVGTTALGRRQRKVTKVTERVVEYDDGRLHWRSSSGWSTGTYGRGTTCTRSTWAAWCSKNAGTYLRAGRTIWCQA
jgi:hypothetical protein